MLCIILDENGLQRVPQYPVQILQSLLPHTFPIHHSRSKETDAHLPSLGGSGQLGLSAGLVGAPLLEQGLRDGDLLQSFLSVSYFFFLPENNAGHRDRVIIG